MSQWQYDQSTESNLMKVIYGRVIEKQFNQDNVIYGRCNKKDNFVGSQLEEVVVQSIGGGVSAGDLPTPSRNKHAKAILRRKKLYARVQIDRESMKAARGGVSSFKDFTKYPVMQATKSFNRNLERQMIRGGVAGEGSLVSGNAGNTNVSGAGTTGSPYVISLDNASTYFPGEVQAIEEGDILNVNDETTELEVTAVTDAVVDGYTTATISVVGTSARLAALSGTGPFDAADDLYMQKSKDKEITGLQGVLTATSGTLYNIAIGRRWQAYQKDAGAAAISTDLLNDLVVNLKRQCGESPTALLMHYHQYIKLLNLLEDKKRYNLPVKNKELKGQISYSAIMFESADGPIPVLQSRFMDSDKVFAINDKHICLHSTPGRFEWMDEDGTVFLRKDEQDAYSARYGGYTQLMINPHFQAIITNLAV